MSSTIHREYKYFHSTVQKAEERQQKFHFCRLLFDLTSCLISVLKLFPFPGKIKNPVLVKNDIFSSLEIKLGTYINRNITDTNSRFA